MWKKEAIWYEIESLFESNAKWKENKSFEKKFKALVQLEYGWKVRKDEWTRWKPANYGDIS